MMLMSYTVMIHKYIGTHISMGTLHFQRPVQFLQGGAALPQVTSWFVKHYNTHLSIHVYIYITLSI